MHKYRKIVLSAIAVLFIIIPIGYSYHKEEKETITTNTDINKKVAYLTFDDGPSANTKKVLDILDKYDVKATFFVIGSQVEEYKDEIKDIEMKGHAIGLHTYSHCYNKIYLSKEMFLEDFYKEYDLLCDILENKPQIYRFPGGSCSCYIGSKKNEIISELERNGFKHYDWNVSAEDSVGNPTEYSIMNNIKKDLTTFDNPIVLMHDSSINSKTVKTLPRIIEYIKSEGYTFGTIKNLR